MTNQHNHLDIVNWNNLVCVMGNKTWKEIHEIQTQKQLRIYLCHNRPNYNASFSTAHYIWKFNIQRHFEYGHFAASKEVCLHFMTSLKKINRLKYYANKIKFQNVNPTQWHTVMEKSTLCFMGTQKVLWSTMKKTALSYLQIKLQNKNHNLK